MARSSRAELTLRSDIARAAVQSAFADIPPPDHPIGAYADAFYGPESGAALYEATDWRLLDHEKLINGHAGSISTLLKVLEPADWRHYLPAFMRISLDHPDDPKHVDAITLVALRPDAPLNHPLDELAAGLTVAQRQAVLLFLEAIYEREFALKGPNVLHIRDEQLAYWRDLASRD